MHQAKSRLPQADSSAHSLNGGAGGCGRAKVSIEDVVQLAHRISAQHSSAAPHNIALAAGDPRRPYPTDAEMRAGFLGHSATPDALSAYCVDRGASAGLDLSATATATATASQAQSSAPFATLALGAQPTQALVAVAINVPSRAASGGLAESPGARVLTGASPSSPVAAFRQPAAAAEPYDVAYMSSGEESD